MRKKVHRREIGPKANQLAVTIQAAREGICPDVLVHFPTLFYDQNSAIEHGSLQPITALGQGFLISDWRIGIASISPKSSSGRMG